MKLQHFIAIENPIEDGRVNRITVIMVSWANYFRWDFFMKRKIIVMKLGCIDLFGVYYNCRSYWVRSIVEFLLHRSFVCQYILVMTLYPFIYGTINFNESSSSEECVPYGPFPHYSLDTSTSTRVIIETFP